jgi:uncharacterized protein
VIVVSNTSPLTNLAAIGQFNLLHNLFVRVEIADGVWAELNAMSKPWPGRDETAAAAWIHRHTVQNQALVNALQQDLDRGEAESIALALELGADLLLLDEREARHAAQRFELRTIGVIGILLEAKAKGFVTSVRPHLDALRQVAGFYLKESLYQAILKQANESN